LQSASGRVGSLGQLQPFWYDLASMLSLERLYGCVPAVHASRVLTVVGFRNGRCA
jgi:hypothetical protein